MKKNHFLVVLALATISLISYKGFSQETEEIPSVKFSDLDKSPHDITYLRIDRTSPPLAKVLYGRPQKKDRVIFGGIVPYGKIWRTGANEATEVTFYKDLEFGGKSLKAGTYVLHSIPGEKEWTIILNSNLNVWGSFQYDEAADVLRVKVPVKKDEKSLEAFTIAFRKGKDMAMILAWDTTRVEIPLSFK
ncbi:MAG TPA: DUF2911 domain-containing protein [Flavobacteriia bacterium]|nr:DUF2911 domain-containing protein [Flavobacteriia bacterium]